MADTQSIILDELRGMRADFNAFAGEIRERVATLEAHDHELYGNGRPGRMSYAEDEINSIRRWQWKILGAGAAASGIGGAIAWIITELRR